MVKTTSNRTTRTLNPLATLWPLAPRECTLIDGPARRLCLRATPGKLVNTEALHTPWG